jgi:hypothetical protein
MRGGLLQRAEAPEETGQHGVTEQRRIHNTEIAGVTKASLSRTSTVTAGAPPAP